MPNFIESGLTVLNMSLSEITRNFFDDGAAFSQDVFWTMMEASKTNLEPWTTDLLDEYEGVQL